MMGRSIRLAAAISFAVALSATIGLAGQSGDEKQAPPPMSPEQQAMMEKWMAFATPGEGHKVLAHKAGAWDFKVTMWPAPGAPPETSTGTSKVEWVMDGRYLADTTNGSFQGQPFMGRGLTGYDNIKKKYVSTWIDNMGTGIMVAEGTYDAAAKAWNYKTETPDVMTGKYAASRSVEKITGPDTWTMESYTLGPDGAEFKMMQIDYTRKK